MSIRALAVLLFAGLTGCTSLWTQRDHQAVQWSDGDTSRIEVWLGQGTADYGQPWLTISDVLFTPVIWIAEVQFACFALAKDDARIAGGPLGFVGSLLPCITCVPLDAKPRVWLHLSDALRLRAEDRAELAQLEEAAAVEWLAARYAEQFGAGAGEQVHRWIRGVALAPPSNPGPPDGE